MRRRHSLAFKTRFDFDNKKKNLIPSVNFNFQNKTICKYFSSQELNSLTEHKRELEQKFTPVILKNLNNNIWPLDDPQMFKQIKNYINLSNYFISILSAKKFIESFSLQINSKYKLLADDYQSKNSKRYRSFVNRKKLKEISNWSEILEEAQLT